MSLGPKGLAATQGEKRALEEGGKEGEQLRAQLTLRLPALVLLLAKCCHTLRWLCFTRHFGRVANRIVVRPL